MPGTPQKTIFVVQRQDRKNGKWEDDAGDWILSYDGGLQEGSFTTKTKALSKAKQAHRDCVEDARLDHEGGEKVLRGRDYENFTVTEGTDLDETIKKMKEAHKKFNPNKSPKKKPFDTDAVYPKFRVIARTFVDEEVEVIR